MGASITCPKKGGNLIDLECCRDCFYKRLDSDYSLRWCRYKGYETVKRNFKSRLEKTSIEIDVLKEEQERLYKTGKVRLAQKVESDIAILKARKEKELLLQKAVAKIIEEAIEINEPGATEIEVYLRENCTNMESAKALLNPQKTLKSCWDEINHKSGGMNLPTKKIFELADKYWGLSEGWRIKR